MIKVEKSIQTTVGDISKVTLQQGELEVILLSYGASIYSIKYRGREMTVRPDDLDAFLTAQFYYGKTCGRTSGRLIAPSYMIDDQEYPVKPFRGETTKLHGGKDGFSYRHFEIVDIKDDHEYSQVTYKIVSPDGDEDYPGELTLYVTYRADQNDHLLITYDAKSTKDTLCSITNHVYVNLDGEGTIQNHHLKIDASHYIDLNENLTPRKKVSLDKTPFDLRKLTKIEGRLKSLKDTPIGGYDHTWVFDRKIGKAVIKDSKKEFALKVSTSYPAFVVFTHNVVTPDPLPERYGNGIQSALTLECEYEPGGIHYSEMSSSILRKDEAYQHWIDLQFEYNPE